MEPVAGADLHKRVTPPAWLRDGRPPSQTRFAHERAAVEGARTRLPAGTTIAVESTGSWWRFGDTARPTGAPPRALPSNGLQCDRRRPREVCQGCCGEAG